MNEWLLTGQPSGDPNDRDWVISAGNAKSVDMGEIGRDPFLNTFYA